MRRPAVGMGCLSGRLLLAGPPAAPRQYRGKDGTRLAALQGAHRFFVMSNQIGL
ncbi:MAG: hypothetical protein Fur007_23180 [Rhodoferax sp.]